MITTNNIPRNLFYGTDLSPHDRSEFSYLEDIDQSLFFNYRGETYSLEDFVRMENDPNEWQGIYNLTAFSGIVVKIVESCESVIVGCYSC